MTPQPEADFAGPPDSGEIHLPDPPEPSEEYDAPSEAPVPDRSLLDDIEALVADARTYVDAELAYQKTRLSYIIDRLKSAAVYGAVGAIVGVVLLITLSVGLIIALAPLITPWGATAVVVLLLAILLFVALRRALSSWNALMDALQTGSDDEGDEP